MLSTAPCTAITHTAGLVDAGEDVVDLATDSVERLGPRLHVDIDDAAQSVVIDFGRRIDLLGEDDRAQWGVVLAPHAAQGDVLKLLHVHMLDLVGGVLHGEHVIVAGIGVDPVARGDDTVRGERGNDVVDDGLGR